MAATEAGSLLTEAYRRSQLDLNRLTIRGVMSIFPAFSLDDIDGTWSAVEPGLLSVMETRREQSIAATARYFRAFRTAEGAPGVAAAIPAGPLDMRTASGLLQLLGPIGAKKNIKTAAPDPLGRTLSRLTGAITREVLNGGRKTLALSVDADPDAVGMRRITSGSACSFCADLASEGIVGAHVDFAAHAHCSCTAEPAY